MYSRRQFHEMTLAGLAMSIVPVSKVGAAKLDSTVKGVKLGLITGTLNPLPTIAGKDPIDLMIEQCIEIGAANVELVSVGGPTGPEVIGGGRFGQAPDTVT